MPSTTARRRSRLGRTTFFVALLAVGLLGLVDLTGEIPGASTIGQGAVPLAAYPALVLAVAGLGLLVGTFWGRARGLILLGVVALVALVPTTAVSVASGDMSGGVARGTVVRPKTLEALDDVQTQHSAGQVTYDLSGLDLDGRDVELELGLGAGELTVLLPQRAGADVLANVGIGKAYVLGRLEDGFGVTASDTRPGHPGGGTVDLTVEVGVGQAKVS